MAILKIVEKRKDLEWDYDPEADVLYLSIGKPRVAESIDIGDGIIVRIDPKSNEIVGITIIGFNKRIMKELNEKTSNK
ncbi:MAG: DUF2283 domain-containing protein [Candidatus Asgardarchaeia archaeon]